MWGQGGGGHRGPPRAPTCCSEEADAVPWARPTRWSRAAALSQAGCAGSNARGQQRGEQTGNLARGGAAPLGPGPGSVSLFQINSVLKQVQETCAHARREAHRVLSKCHPHPGQETDYDPLK